MTYMIYVVAARSLAELQLAASWMRWFTRALLASLYPGSPFERKFLAMQLLNALVSVWNVPDKALRGSHPNRCDQSSSWCGLWWPACVPLCSSCKNSA